MQLVRPRRRHAGPDQEQARSGRDEVIEKFGVDARQGDRRPGAGRRFDRQRAGRARHRREDRGPADQRVRRPRDAAGARRRDQAAQAPRGADRQCRAGAHLARAGHAQGRRAGCRAAGGLECASPIPTSCWRFLRAAGLQLADRALEGELGAEATAPVGGSAGSGRPPRAGSQRLPPAARAESNRSRSTAAATSWSRRRARSTRWIAAAPRAGTVAFDTETDALDRDARRAGRHLAWRSSPARALPICRSAIASRRQAQGARPRRRGRGAAPAARVARSASPS